MRTLKLFVSVCLVSLAVGCGTVTPDHAERTEASYDASTPSQYDPYNSGVLYPIVDREGDVIAVAITPLERDRYNDLIKVYRNRFKETAKVTLDADDGISDTVDEYGNKLFLIDVTHLGYLESLEQYARDKE
jgi:hypothetical protein